TPPGRHEHDQRVILPVAVAIGAAVLLGRRGVHILTRCFVPPPRPSPDSGEGEGGTRFNPLPRFGAELGWGYVSLLRLKILPPVRLRSRPGRCRRRRGGRCARDGLGRRRRRLPARAHGTS